MAWNSWVDDVNGWSKTQPKPHELFFGSWVSWILLTYMFRHYPLHVKEEALPTWKIAYMHMWGAFAYIFNHYLSDKQPVYAPLFYTYCVVFFILWYYLLVKPVLNIFKEHGEDTTSFACYPPW